MRAKQIAMKYIRDFSAKIQSYPLYFEGKKTKTKLSLDFGFLAANMLTLKQIQIVHLKIP